MPSLAAKAKYILLIAGSRGSKAPLSSLLQPRLQAGKAGRPKDGTAKPAREGKSRRGKGFQAAGGEKAFKQQAEMNDSDDPDQ